MLERLIYFAQDITQLQIYGACLLESSEVRMTVWFLRLHSLEQTPDPVTHRPAGNVKECSI
jgi:hypothetical protein